MIEENKKKKKEETKLKRKMEKYLYSQVLWSIPPGDSMDKGRGYDNMIGYTVVVSVSASCSRCHNLT